MGFARNYYRALRIVFIVSMFLLESDLLHLTQPILFVIGYLDFVLLLCFLGLLFVLAKSIIASLIPALRRQAPARP
jgi:hypothetical protein